MSQDDNQPLEYGSDEEALYECGQRFTEKFIDTEMQRTIALDAASSAKCVDKQEDKKQVLEDAPGTSTQRASNPDFFDDSVFPDDICSQSIFQSTIDDQQSQSVIAPTLLESEFLLTDESTSQARPKAAISLPCGRPFVHKDLVPKTFIQDNMNHPWMQPHPTREIAIAAHFCPCCNHPTPNLYECLYCDRLFHSARLDEHEKTCASRNNKDS